MKIVFDVDDTLWSLNDVVCNRLGIDKSKMNNFVIQQNENLTKQEQEAVLAEYRNAENFKNIKWFKGVEYIHDLIELGHQVCINSNNCSKEIAELKRIQLHDELHIPYENIKMNIISHETCREKQMEDNVDIFVDDSPFNIARSTAKVNLMIEYPWNMTEEALSLIDDKVLIVRNLKDVMTYIQFCLPSGALKVS